MPDHFGLTFIPWSFIKSVCAGRIMPDVYGARKGIPRESVEPYGGSRRDALLVKRASPVSQHGHDVDPRNEEI